MMGMIETVPGVTVEYIAFNRWDSLEEIDTIKGKVLISMVAKVGPVRLLDNVVISG